MTDDTHQAGEANPDSLLRIICQPPKRERLLWRTSSLLPAGQQSGQFTISIPFSSTHVAVINPTSATLWWTEGQVAQTSPDAVLVPANGSLSTAMQPNHHITVNWWSPQAIAAPGGAVTNQVLLIFSDEPISLESAAANPTGIPQVSLTGSSAPLVAAAPTLIATIPFSDFVANASYLSNLKSVFHRNARSRTLTIFNDTNANFSGAVNFYQYDSVVQTGSSVGPGVSLPYTIVGTYDSETYTALSALVDSAFLTIPIGATAPSLGNVLIYVTEKF